MKFRPFIHMFIFLLAIFALPGRAAALDIDSKQLGSFVGFMRLAKDSLPETRYALWHRHCYGPNAEAMQKAVFLTTDETKIKRSMMKALKGIFANHAMHLGVMENLRDNFETMLESAVGDFKKAFPDADFAEFKFYLVAGNHSFNARASLVDGKPAFEMAAEMFEDPEGVRVTLMHELFHLYHLKRLERAGVKMEERLFLPLILEGCAVYFSKASTGASNELCIGMGLPKYAGTFDAAGFAGKCKRNAAAAAREMLENIDSPVSGEVYDKFFKARRDNEEMPARIGYFLGLKIIEGAVIKGMPLEKIVALDRDGIVALCRKRLEEWK